MAFRTFPALLLEGLGDLLVGLVVGADAYFVHDLFGIAPAVGCVEGKCDGQIFRGSPFASADARPPGASRVASQG